MVNKQENVTAGFPNIEKLVETEQFDEINKNFTQAHEELQKIAKAKSGMGKGKAAKKAMRAYELTMELFKELLKLKYQMMEAMEKKQNNK